MYKRYASPPCTNGLGKNRVAALSDTLYLYSCYSKSAVSFSQQSTKLIAKWKLPRDHHVEVLTITRTYTHTHTHLRKVYILMYVGGRYN